jgi:hypothetical protein
VRKALTSVKPSFDGGNHLLRPGLASPELTRAQNAHLRRALVRRRSASVPALSSGKHSLAGEQLLPGTATPLSGALTGGNYLLLPGLDSPELTRAQNSHLRLAHRSTEDSLRPRTQLRPTFARRRTAVTGDLNSVETGAHRRKAPSPTRVGFVGADACAKLSPPSSPRSTEISLRPRT